MSYYNLFEEHKYDSIEIKFKQDTVTIECVTCNKVLMDISDIDKENTANQSQYTCPFESTCQISHCIGMLIIKDGNHICRASGKEILKKIK